MSRFLEIVCRGLAVVGLTALGIVSGCFGLMLLSALTIFRYPPGTSAESHQMDGVLIVFIGVFGALVGGVGAFAAAMARLHRMRIWPLPVVLASLLGLVVGYLFRVFQVINPTGVFGYLIEWPWTGMVFIVACGAACGLLASFISCRLGVIDRGK